MKNSPNQFRVVAGLWRQLLGKLLLILQSRKLTDQSMTPWRPHVAREKCVFLNNLVKRFPRCMFWLLAYCCIPSLNGSDGLVYQQTLTSFSPSCSQTVKIVKRTRNGEGSSSAAANMFQKAQLLLHFQFMFHSFEFYMLGLSSCRQIRKTTGNCGNPRATISITTRFLTEHLLCNWFRTVRASDLQEPLPSS